MSKWAYYNEFDPAAAQWLRNLIAAGHIAPGVVDERSIEDVSPDDLREFRQCHFFAGIGVWSYALRRAGWPDDRRVWTGSCPCQPFSAAGAQAGFADERHLWPAFHYLIAECRPPVVFGEQVASKAAEPWVDLVHADLEALGYAFAGIPFPSAGVGAPHIRDRLFRVGHAHRQRLEGHAGHDRATGWCRQAGPVAEAGVPGRLVDTDRPKSEQSSRPRAGPREAQGRGSLGQPDGRDTVSGPRQAGPVNGFWRAADWLLCRDGKWRPVESGTFPLADGTPARVVRLRAYGNALNAEAATVFIESYCDARSAAEALDGCLGCEPCCEECEL